MSVVQIQAPGVKPPAFALFQLGFRPFFLLAGLFSLVSILVWAGAYVYHWPLPALPVAAMAWHGHEMIFGYALAVVAGFLLTAVRNWTNIPTLRGAPLAALAALWLAARLVMGVFPQHIGLAMALDLAFGCGLIAAITTPLARAGQWKQFGIVAKVLLLVLANGLFYLGARGDTASGVAWGLYSGLYLILSLIFVMARRVVPFFIERGVGYAVTLTNRVWVDRASLVLMLAFWIAEVFLGSPALAAGLAAALFVVHAVRLFDWHTPGIWKKPLLWILYLGYGAAVLGFPLKVLAAFGLVSPYLPVHAFAAGGIGLMTIGMMARVSLGHTGRSVQAPPAALAGVFALMVAAFVVRVLLAALWPQAYAVWIGLAQLLWVAGFAGFLVLYAPMLVRPRVDGQPG